MLKLRTTLAHIPLPLLLRRPNSNSNSNSSPSPTRRLPSFLPASNSSRRMSTQAPPDAGVGPKFAPLPLDHGRVATSESQPESPSPAGAAYLFRLVSYNILAQVYVKSAYFTHSPRHVSSEPLLDKWKARSKAVLTELKSFGADLICVQELDEYDTFYRKNMENSGYSSIYIQRPGEKQDGCGIFYKPRSVELVLKEQIHYNDLVEICGVNENVNTVASNNCSPTEASSVKMENYKHGDPNDPRVRLKRDCVGLLAAFKLSDPCNHLIILANTHIYWDPDWVDVKLAQAKYLLSRVSKFEELVSKKFNCKPSVIIAGDFNSTPGDKVYNYIVSANSESTEVPIKLYSLYAANGGEPEFTNCTPGFTGTLDYIFLSDSSSLKPTSLLCVPGGNSADVLGGLPNFHHPSDHLPIGGDFQVLIN